MTDTPLADALRDVPKNELLIQAGATQAEGAAASVTLEREKELKNGSISGGLVAGASQRRGWGIGAFIKRVWR